MMQTELQSAIVVPADGGDVWNVMGTLMWCKVHSEDTDGVYSIVENVVPPQAGPPPHVHHIGRGFLRAGR